ncbi:MAG: gluconate 2-dehydrogenase subunit 3 family protein [Bryobacteraceae bacterium]
MSSEENKKKSGSLNRRDLLQAITLAPAAAMVPLAALASPAATAKSGEAYKPKIFNPHEWKMIHVLSDRIIPADERTGSASQAGVPEFLDDWLNLKGGLLKTEVLGGLAWIDMECNRHFRRDFVDCSEAQQNQILDRIAYPAKAAPADANAVAAFNRIRDLVLGGFYSSKMGIADLQYKGNKALAEWDGCPEEVTSRLHVDYSDWKHWNQGAAEKS